MSNEPNPDHNAHEEIKDKKKLSIEAERIVRIATQEIEVMVASNHACDTLEVMTKIAQKNFDHAKGKKKNESYVG